MSGALSQKITELIVRLLQAKGVEKAVVNPGDFLYEGGLGLDSLDAATLAAMLENEFKSDPYNSGEFPQTVAEIVSFYSRSSNSGPAN
ncbi:MAG: acyl carrier protein [Terriglobales bacterium]